MKRVFLLGGMDAEMSEIKYVLDENKELVSNLNLSWGAKLSMYE